MKTPITRTTISASRRYRRVQICRFVGLTCVYSRVYYGVTPASFARLERVMAPARVRPNFADFTA